MHPEVSEEQAELKASVERFWRGRIDAPRLAAWSEEPAGIDDASRREIGELGWFGIGVPAEHGGSGLGLVEVGCVLEECARGLVPRCIAESIRSAAILARIDPQAPELTALAAGEESMAIAADERSARRWENYSTMLKSVDGQPRVAGEKYCVLYPQANWHLVAAADDSGVALLVVPGASGRRSDLRSFDGSLQSVVTYDDAVPARQIAAGHRGVELLRDIERVQCALALAEMVGGMTAALDATVDYVKQREQFGQKLGVFQAVQHQVADMALALTASRHLAWQAICRLDAGTEQGIELETAAVYVARSFKDVTIAAHHLHGGAGYVVEHPLHYHSERAQALAIRYAPSSDGLAAVAANLLD